MNNTQKVTLTQVRRYTTGRDGSPLIGKNGKPYERVQIQTQQHGQQWLSGFGGLTTSRWAPGAVVDIEVKQRVGNNGMTMLDFSVPNAQNQLAQRVSVLEAQVRQLMGQSQAKPATDMNGLPPHSFSQVQGRVATSVGALNPYQVDEYQSIENSYGGEETEVDSNWGGELPSTVHI